jgi:hypothetical protein
MSVCLLGSRNPAKPDRIAHLSHSVDAHNDLVPVPEIAEHVVERGYDTPETAHAR